jgi:hypothetical protein
MINSGILLYTGNTAGMVVSLSIIAAYCIVQDRFGWIGALCLAIALAMKPHDAGLLWFYFLLAGGVQRKRALQALAFTAAIVLPAVLWVSHSAPHWAPELQANLAAGLSSGGLNDPGPTTQGGRGFGMIISLQALLSLIWNDSRFYNPATYFLCGALLLVWSVKTWRAGFSPKLAWLALAAISALTMLPVYHRNYDARLLVLTIPACAMLWKRGRWLGWCALTLTLAAIILTGDIFWVVLFGITHYSGSSGTFGIIAVPLVLLSTGIFYLWVYLRGDPAPVPAAVQADL